MLRRSPAPDRAHRAYDQAVREVVGAPDRRRVDALALVWAHQIAWAQHATPLLTELDLLSATARRYALPLDAVLAELRHQQQAPPVIPAGRSATPGTSDVLRLA